MDRVKMQVVVHKRTETSLLVSKTGRIADATLLSVTEADFQPNRADVVGKDRLRGRTVYMASQGEIEMSLSLAVSKGLEPPPAQVIRLHS